MAEHDRSGALGSASSGAPGSASVTRHLARGAAGFGLIGSAFALTSAIGPGALLLVLPGMVALRGCPTCWIAGLLQAISVGRLERACTETGCTLRVPGGAAANAAGSPSALEHGEGQRPCLAAARVRR